MRSTLTIMALLLGSAVAHSQGPMLPPGQGPMAPRAPMWTQLPLEMLCLKADLIAVVKVTEVVSSQETEVKLHELAKPLKEDFASFKADVVKVFRDDIKPGEERKHPRTVEVLASKIAMPVKATGVSGRGGFEYVCPVEKDKTYVLLLRKPANSEAWYLPADPRQCREATDDVLKRYEKAADVERWPWGKEVGGLQVALLVEPSATIQVLPVNPMNAGGKGAANIGFACGLAVRNAGDKAISLNVNPADRRFSISLSGAGTSGGTPPPESLDLYQELYKPKAAANPTAEIKPKQALIVNVWGEADKAQQVYLKLEGGKYTLQADYKNEGGALQSTTVEVEVKDTGIRPVPMPPIRR